MTKDKKILLSISITLCFILFFALFIPSSFVKIVALLVLMIGTILLHLFVKKRSILAIQKRQVLIIMLVVGLMVVLAYALSGLSFGFYKSLDILNVENIFKNILPSIFIIVLIEIIRRILLAQNSKFVNVISFVIGLFSEIIVLTNITDINSFNELINLFGMVLFPGVTSNILYTHVSKKYGSLPNIIYRIILVFYPFILPFSVGTPLVLIAIFKLIIPLVVYYFIYILYTNTKKQKVAKKSWTSYVVTGILILVMISISMIISCQFKYGLLVVGSSSMTGELNKGDAILYEEYTDQFIKEGDVIVFVKDKTTVIHRVVEVKNVGGKKMYFTKGDANEDRDIGYITDGDIIGVTKLKILYIGLPTLWMREILG